MGFDLKLGVALFGCQETKTKLVNAWRQAMRNFESRITFIDPNFFLFKSPFTLDSRLSPDINVFKSGIRFGPARNG